MSNTHKAELLRLLRDLFAGAFLSGPRVEDFEPDYYLDHDEVLKRINEELAKCEPWKSATDSQP